MSFTTADILEQLDAHAEEFSFPGFNNMNFETADARLRAYRDADRWAMIVEELVDWPAADGLTTITSAFGNALLVEPGLGPMFSPLEPSEIDEDEIPATVSIRGRSVALESAPIQALMDEHEIESSFAVLIWLCDAHRDALLCSTEELQQIVPADLPELIKLDTWNHPDVYGGPKPSESEAFIQLAEALATGDLAKIAPTEAPNNRDWAFWQDNK